MIGITTHAIAHHFGIDIGAPLFGGLVLFQYHHAGTVTQHETIAVSVPGPTGPFRVVIAAGEGASRGKTTQTQVRCGHFGTAGHHNVGVTVLDHAGRITDAVSCGGAGRYRCDVWPLEAIANRQVTGDHIDNTGRDQKR